MKFFVHIEKAGGTSLHHCLLNSFSDYTILPPVRRGYGKRYEIDDFKKIERFVGKATFYGGHQVSSIPNLSDFGDNHQYITFIRNPVERCLSHINWLMHTRNDYTIDELLKGDRLDNIMCFRISGKKSFVDTKEHILNRQYFVGIMERFDESIFLLSHWLGVNNMHYKKANVLRKEQKQLKTEDLTEQQIQRLKEKNEEDIKLYKFVLDNLYPMVKSKLLFDKQKFETWKMENQAFKGVGRWLVLKNKLRGKIIKKIIS